ncbi:hypothetical protein [Longibacter salinarum]|nr:hypothetical protein [Longibacter salinarum]
MVSRCRTLGRWRMMLILVLVGAVTLGSGEHERKWQATGPPDAIAEMPSAEDHVLTLRRAVRAPGETAYRGKTLPAGTIIVVYQEYGDEPHTIDRQGYSSRDALVHQIVGTVTGTGQRGLGSNVRVDTLNGLGRSRERYAGTAPRGSGVSPSTFITYVAARLPNGELLESYVNAGKDGYTPGFDAVWSGRMTMGPVPHDSVDAINRLFDSVLFPVGLPEVASSALAAVSGGLPRVSGGTSSPFERERGDTARASNRQSVERTSSRTANDRVQEKKRTPRQQESNTEIPFVRPPDDEFASRGGRPADQVRDRDPIPLESDDPELRHSSREDVRSVARVEGIPPTKRVPRESTAGVNGWWLLLVGILMGMVGVAIGVKYREQIIRLPNLIKSEEDEEPPTDLVPQSQEMMTARLQPPFTDTAPEFNLDDSFWDVRGESQAESRGQEGLDDLRFQEDR